LLAAQLSPPADQKLALQILQSVASHADGGDGARPQRLGAAGGMVSPSRRAGHLVPPEQSADLRDHYSKHAKSDHLDFRMLARLPLLHPKDCARPRDWDPPMRRAAPASCGPRWVKRRNTILARLDAYLELLGPTWHAAFGGDLASNTCLRFLAAGYARPPRAGTVIRFWADCQLIHLSAGGARIKTLRSYLSVNDLPGQSSPLTVAFPPDRPRCRLSKTARPSRWTG
jgi:hypothetical protein